MTNRKREIYSRLVNEVSSKYLNEKSGLDMLYTAIGYHVIGKSCRTCDFYREQSDWYHICSNKDNLKDAENMVYQKFIQNQMDYVNDGNHNRKVSW